MWNIDNNTPGRSLIIPVSTATSDADLGMAAIAWEWIGIKLADGSTVYDAVSYANGQLAVSQYADGTPVALRFRAVGGNEGRDVKKK